MARHTVCIAGALLTLLARPTLAGDADNTAKPQQGNVEFSSGVSALFTSPAIVGIGARITGGSGGRFSLEAGLDWTGLSNEEPRPDQIVWLLFWQVKHNIWSSASSTLFATYGTAGWRQWDLVGPDRLELSFIPPILPILGFGLQRTLGGRLAIRGDAQVFLGPGGDQITVPRVAVGIVIPLRSYSR